MITRFGGDEFIVLQTSCKHERDAEWLARRMVRAVQEPFEIDGHRIDIGASIGVAIAPNDGSDVDQLLKKADMALYTVKIGGHGGCCLFAGQMEEATQARRALELDLRQALAGERFELHFQPGQPRKRPRDGLRGVAAVDTSHARPLARLTSGWK